MTGSGPRHVHDWGGRARRVGERLKVFFFFFFFFITLEPTVE